MNRQLQLDELIAAYLEAEQAGTVGERADWLRRAPELADDLRRFFDQHDHRGADPEATTDAVTLPHRPPEVEATSLSFGDYEILEEIARGGMGVVFKARQVSLNRIVALKMILAGQLASPADVQRFRTEAEAAARLDHPGIVPIYEVGEHGGRQYLAMGFVEGGSLANKGRSGSLPPRESAALIEQVARAIDYAHQRGIIHRDLKPANILLDTEGRPRISDFGLARMLHDDPQLTLSGQVVGTPSYMPPEQAAGRRDQVGTAADVYALGACFYRLLTGRPPFQAGSVMETLRQVQESEPVSPRSLRPEVPRDLESVCLKCLEKDPARRYPSAAAVADELRRFLAGEPVQVRPPGLARRLARWGYRHRLAVALTLAVALLIGAVWWASTMVDRRPSVAQTDAEAAAEIRELLPAAAALPYEDVEDLERGMNFQAKSQTLTWVFFQTPLETWIGPPEPGVEKGVKALLPHLADKDRGYLTVMKPEFITRFNCRVTGDMAEGYVWSKPFSVELRVRYVARRTAGRWRIEEFHGDDLKGRVLRQPDGTWRFESTGERAPPAEPKDLKVDHP